MWSKALIRDVEQGSDQTSPGLIPGDTAPWSEKGKANAGPTGGQRGANVGPLWGGHGANEGRVYGGRQHCSVELQVLSD
ncbi:unnamed protein product [Boreogadus saida]